MTWTRMEAGEGDDMWNMYKVGGSKFADDPG
jgi:hypothetical protein